MTLFLAFHKFLESNMHFTIKTIPMLMLILSVPVNQEEEEEEEESSVCPIPS
jgi:hypothetical protein